MVTVVWTDYNGVTRTDEFENEMKANIFIKGLENEERGHTFEYVEVERPPEMPA